MRFHQEDNEKIQRSVIVVSDVHLGAGPYINHRRNHLEDFHHDKQFVDFIEYYSTDHYEEREVELIINGDFFDLLAVPFIPFFDDEFWSEEAATLKLMTILEAHQDVLMALIRFIGRPNKKITYIVGNHDAELILPGVREHFYTYLPENLREKFLFRIDQDEYLPLPGILIKHGHQYEAAHTFSVTKSIAFDEKNTRYFIPPWGSYYVTRVVNKFKAERSYINEVKPIKTFLLYGLLSDTLFTARFILSTFLYFFMVRVIYFHRKGFNLKKILEFAKRELTLFQDYETLTEDFIQSRNDLKALIVGHTHEAAVRNYANGKVFINTGTWTKMVFLDFARRGESILLTYAQIDESLKEDGQKDNYSHIKANLFVWKGRNRLPFKEFQ